MVGLQNLTCSTSEGKGFGFLKDVPVQSAFLVFLSNTKLSIGVVKSTGCEKY